MLIDGEMEICFESPTSTSPLSQTQGELTTGLEGSSDMSLFHLATDALLPFPPPTLSTLPSGLGNDYPDPQETSPVVSFTSSSGASNAGSEASQSSLNSSASYMPMGRGTSPDRRRKADWTLYKPLGEAFMDWTSSGEGCGKGFASGSLLHGSTRQVAGNPFAHVVPGVTSTNNYTYGTAIGGGEEGVEMHTPEEWSAFLAGINAAVASNAAQQSQVSLEQSEQDQLLMQQQQQQHQEPQMYDGGLQWNFNGLHENHVSLGSTSSTLAFALG